MTLSHRLFAPLLLLTILLAGCKDDDTAVLAPVAFEAEDECHVCGMATLGFPGPKGEAFEGRKNIVRKFCSTRDLVSWYLQPENQPNTGQMYVHDMARSDWNHPDDSHLIDARSAIYVVGSSQKGAMGPTLASFATAATAEHFANQFGGKLFAFDELTLEIVNQTGDASTGSHAAHSGH